LLLEQALDRVYAPEILRYAQQFIAVERFDHGPQFMQDLLEPQFVDLMNDDKEQFVMMFRPRKRSLKADEFVDLQI
jgi:hypothetical protein